MSAAEIKLWFYSRPDRSLTIEQRHSKVMSGMSSFGAPLGFKGIDLPPAPDCGDGLSTVYGVKLATKGLKFVGDYLYRGDKYVYEDCASFDERLRYGFKVSNKLIGYKFVLNEQVPEVVRAFGAFGAFGAYRALVLYDMYGFNYKGGLEDSNLIYNKLRENKNLDVDGRNNIYTLYPAQFWDAELCQRALGYGPEEVIARLQGRVQRVERLLDGVYLLINDDPNLSYDEFVEMNERVKPILGLVWLDVVL